MKKITLMVLFCTYYSAQSQVGIGIPSPDASAALEVSSTNKGFLPPRLTTSQRNSIANPAKGLTIYNTSKECLEWYVAPGYWYNGCGDNVAVVDSYLCNPNETGVMIEGVPTAGVEQIITVDVKTVGNYTISATANNVTFSATGIFKATGVQDIVLIARGTPLARGDHKFTLNTSPTNCSFTRSTIETIQGAAGRIWMAYNLGATAPASSSNDSTQYGDLYQWGRDTDGHEKKTSFTIYTTSPNDVPNHKSFIGQKDWRTTPNNNLWKRVHGTNNPCPSGFRIPTRSEWDAEISAAGITNSATAYSSALKLPLPGFRFYTGTYANPGIYGGYWHGNTNDTNEASYCVFTAAGISNNYNYKGYGFSVRCIKD